MYIEFSTLKNNNFRFLPPAILADIHFIGWEYGNKLDHLITFEKTPAIFFGFDQMGGINPERCT